MHVVCRLGHHGPSTKLPLCRPPNGFRGVVELLLLNREELSSFLSSARFGQSEKSGATTFLHVPNTLSAFRECHIFQQIVLFCDGELELAVSEQSMAPYFESDSREGKGARNLTLLK